MGPTGPQGIKGDKGDTSYIAETAKYLDLGDTGHEIRFYNKPSDPVVIIGWAFADGSQSDCIDQYAFCNGAGGYAAVTAERINAKIDWSNVENKPSVIGPTGPQGATGGTGPVGPTGPQGPAGSTSYTANSATYDSDGCHIHNQLNDLRERMSNGTYKIIWDGSSLRFSNYINTNMVGISVLSRESNDWAIVDTISIFKSSDNIFYTTARGNYLSGCTSWSDKRIKKNINKSAVNALDTINKIELYEYDFVDPKFGGHKDIGYVAQQLIDVVPECVISVPQNKEQFGYNELYQVQDSHMIPYLLKAVQELSARVNELEKKLSDKE